MAHAPRDCRTENDGTLARFGAQAPQRGGQAPPLRSAPLARVFLGVGRLLELCARLDGRTAVLVVSAVALSGGCRERRGAEREEEAQRDVAAPSRGASAEEQEPVSGQESADRAAPREAQPDEREPVSGQESAEAPGPREPQPDTESPQPREDEPGGVTWITLEPDAAGLDAGASTAPDEAAARRGAAETPDAGSAEYAFFECLRRGRRETVLSQEQVELLCRGAPSSGRIDCYQEAHRRTTLAPPESIELCRYAAGPEPVDCFLNSQRTGLELKETIRYCQLVGARR